MGLLPTRILRADNENDVANGTFISVVVKGPSDVNRLLMFTGTAILNFAGNSENEPDTSTIANVEIILMEKFPFSIPKGVPWSATYVSLASEASDAAPTDDNDECRFDIGQNDGDISTFLDGDSTLKLRATLIAGIDSHFNRIAYQANVLVHAD